jgi:hypothetical protein
MLSNLSTRIKLIEINPEKINVILYTSKRSLKPTIQNIVSKILKLKGWGKNVELTSLISSSHHVRSRRCPTRTAPAEWNRGYNQIATLSSLAAASFMYCVPSTTSRICSYDNCCDAAVMNLVYIKSCFYRARHPSHPLEMTAPLGQKKIPNAKMMAP